MDKGKYLEYKILVLYEKIKLISTCNVIIRCTMPFLAEYDHFFKRIKSSNEFKTTYVILSYGLAAPTDKHSQFAKAGNESGYGKVALY
jgi:hypothetical protein